MDKILTKLIASMCCLFAVSCVSRVETVEHHVPKGYEGWILILFEGKPEQRKMDDPDLVYFYDEAGIAIEPNRITYDWRKDKFYYIAKEGDGIPVEGEIETSGSRYYRELNNTYYFISGWVGKKPSSGRAEHLNAAILRAEGNETESGQETINPNR